MTFREVSVIAVREMLRWWLSGDGLRTVARRAQVDRKTVRRYVEAAGAAGLQRGDGEGKLTDELLGAVAEAVKAGRTPGEHGEVWALLEQHRSFIEERLAKDLTMTKVHGQLTRATGESLPFSTFRRFCQAELGQQRDRPCGWPTASRDPSSRWTSAAWGCCSTSRPAATASSTPSSSRRCSPATCSCSSPSARRSRL